MQLRDSWLRCPRDGKRMVVDPLDEEGQAIVTHQCLSCSWRERAPGQPWWTTDSPFMRSLRQETIHQVREQYGRHQILHAPDGGCRKCPLGPMDPIHYWPKTGAAQ